MDQVVMTNYLIATRYLKGWFTVDFISSIPLDTISIISGVEIHTILRLNKVISGPHASLAAQGTARPVTWLSTSFNDAPGRARRCCEFRACSRSSVPSANRVIWPGEAHP